MGESEKDTKKESVGIAGWIVDVSHCGKRLRAIAVKRGGKMCIGIGLTNIPASAQFTKGIVGKYRSRWNIDVFFKEWGSCWHLVKLSGRKLNAVKCMIFFNVLAYNLIFIFKKSLSEKCQNVGIKMLRRGVLRKNAFMYFNDSGFELVFRAENVKVGYQGYIASINSFVEKMDVLELDSRSH